MSLRDDHWDGLLDASISKHYALHENVGVYGKGDDMHSDGCGKSCYGDIKRDKVGFLNRTQWGLVGEKRQWACEALVVLGFETRSNGR